MSLYLDLVNAAEKDFIIGASRTQLMLSVRSTSSSILSLVR